MTTKSSGRSWRCSQVNDDLAVVGQAADGDEQSSCTQVVPDVVLMDLLPGVDGIGGNPWCLAVGRLVLSDVVPDRSRVTAALDAGAWEYLLKDAQPDEIARAIRSANGGFPPISITRVHRTLEGSPSD